MALLFYDGFTYTDDIDDIVRNGWEISALKPIVLVNEFDANNVVYLNAPNAFNNSSVTKSFAKSNEIILGLHAKRLTARELFIRIYDNSDRLFGFIQFYIGDSVRVYAQNVLLGSHNFSSTFFDEYRYLEFRLKMGATTGEIELKINEADFFKYENVDTLPSGGSGIEKIEIAAYSFSQWKIANIYCLNTTGAAPHNNFLGICRVITQRPDEDVSGYVDFTPSSGSDRYAMVNETTPDYSMTVNTSNDAAEKDIYSFDTPVSGPGTIYAVQPKCLAKKKTAGGSGAGLKPVLLCDCGLEEGNLFYPEYDDWNYNDATDISIWITDPDTGLAWTKGDVNTLKAGFKVGG